VAQTLQLSLGSLGDIAMNQMFDLKTEQLRKDLADIDQKLIDVHRQGNDDKVRQLIDSRRFCLARLKSELHSKNPKSQSSFEEKMSTAEVDAFVKSWCSRVTNTALDKIAFENEDFCNLFIDRALPVSWHFDNDIVVIISPPTSKIIEILKNRRQKNIVVYFDNVPSEAILDTHHTFDGVYVCESANDLERTFALLQAPAKQVIKISCNSEPSKTDETIKDAISAGKRTRFENTRTASRFGHSWATNVVKNLPAIANAKNIHELLVKGVEDAVIVASGPSLNKNVDKLSEIQDKVFIITALRSLPVLNAAGVTPDLVIQLDAEDDEVARRISPDEQYPIKNLLVELIVNPAFLNMPNEQIIWSLAQHFFDIHQYFGTKPTQFNVPSVSIYALCLCHALRFKNIAFIGQDLAANGDKQYADGATSLLPAHAKMSMFHIEVPGFYGKSVMTRNSFEYQIKRCGELARDWVDAEPDLNLVNATEGGAFIDGFTHMSLSSFAESRNLSDKNIRKVVEFKNDTPISQEEVRSYLTQVRRTLDSVIEISNTVIKLDMKPEKTRGLQKKLQKTIQKFQTLNNTTSLLLIAMQNRISKVIGTSEEGQKIDTYSEFFEKVKECSTALRNTAKRSDT
jgi:hypothetical protein